jgi:hypothetical protein
MTIALDRELKDNPTVEEMKKLPIIGKQPSSDKEEAFLREICEFEFVNLKEPGVFHKFTYGSTKHHANFTFFHGQKYKVPRFLARHVENCSTPIYEWRPNGLGQMIKTYVGTDQRFQMRQSYNGSMG